MARHGEIMKRAGQEHRQALVKLINSLQYKHDRWRIWDDLMYMSAAALSQPADFKQEREEEYLKRIKYYDKSTQQVFPQMFAEIVLAFEQEKFADILGDIYMELELYNKWHGQYFTPYHICDLMAKITYGDIKSEIGQHGYRAVCDPCCGGGAMLIAFAQYCHEQEVNYQQNVLFVAQDIDPVVARMCYVQMSLLGMPGYVAVGNSLTQPLQGHVLAPAANGNDVWYTPMYFHKIWHYRRTWHSVTSIMSDLPENGTKDAKTVINTPENRNDTAKTTDIEPIMLNELPNGQFQMSF